MTCAANLLAKITNKQTETKQTNKKIIKLPACFNLATRCRSCPILAWI